MEIKDLSKLDLAFVIDSTSSMASYIENAKKNINKIFDEIIKSEKCHLRLGLVNYRDHPPQDSTYITLSNDLTDDIEKAKNYISTTSALGGGDLPEAICCGLNESLINLSWRNDSIKIVILIADAPPHGLGCFGDGFASGCPDLNDPVEIAHRMAEKGITLYVCGCEPSLNPYRQFFASLALITGGNYFPLENAERLAEFIIGGAREEVSMEKLMAKIHDDLLVEAKGNKINEEELTKRIKNLINSKGSNEKDKNQSIFETIKISDEIKLLSKQETLEKMKDFAKTKKISLTNNNSRSLSISETIIPILKKTPPKTIDFSLHLKHKKKPSTKKFSIQPRKFEKRISKRLVRKSVCLGSLFEMKKVTNKNKFSKFVYLRRSQRLLIKNLNTNEDSFKNSEILLKISSKNSKIKEKKLNKNFKMETEDSENENMDLSRRLAKKTIARTKFNSK